MTFYGQFDPPTDKLLYERYFQGKHNGIVIEAGASDGIHLSNTKFFEDKLGWKAIHIEPHPDLFAQLLRNRPNSLNIHGALSNNLSKKWLKHNKRFVYRAHLVDKKNDSDKKFSYIKVTCIDYCSLLENNDIENVDLLVIDTVGHEFEVLKGMYGTDTFPFVLCISMEKFNIEKRKQLLRLLRSYGYRYDGKIRINCFFVHKNFDQKMIR